MRVDGDYEDAVARAQRLGAEAGIADVPDVSYDADAPSPAWCTEGYSTLFRELAEQAPEPLELLVVPIGVGSLAAAAVRFAAHHDPPIDVVGVEPATAACVTESLRAGEPVTVDTSGTTMAGLDCARPSAVAWPTLRDGLLGTVTVSDDELVGPMQLLAGLGLRIGESGAAPFAALEAIVEELEWRVPVLVATEGVTDPDSYHRVV